MQAPRDLLNENEINSRIKKIKNLLMIVPPFTFIFVNKVTE